LDFSPAGDEPYLNPGFSPITFWALEQPWGSHAIYATTMIICNLQPPTLPWDWFDEALQGPETEIPTSTLKLLRVAAIVCAATGLMLITRRFLIAGALASILLLIIPHVPSDLSHA
jgi:hypothetical protein